MIASQSVLSKSHLLFRISGLFSIDIISLSPPKVEESYFRDVSSWIPTKFPFSVERNGFFQYFSPAIWSFLIGVEQKRWYYVSCWMGALSASRLKRSTTHPNRSCTPWPVTAEVKNSGAPMVSARFFTSSTGTTCVFSGLSIYWGSKVP